MLRDIRYLDEGSSFGPWHLTWQDPRPDTLPRLVLPERKRETIRGQAVPYDQGEATYLDEGLATLNAKGQN